MSNHRIRKKRAKKNGRWFPGFKVVPRSEVIGLGQLVDWEGNVLCWHEGPMIIVDGREK